MNFMPRLFFFFLFSVLTLPLHATDFANWRDQLIRDAIGHGIRPQTAYGNLSDLVLDDDIIEKEQKQPEKTVTAVTYWARVVNHSRIEKGRDFLEGHRAVLNQIGDMYDVPPRFIVALIGIESDYGDVQGDNDVVRSLATLAYVSERQDMFRGELFEALRIIDQGNVRRSALRGSWAGAMGYCQFMPSSFFRYGQDFEGNGRIDIWSSVADAAASTANYLHQNGWRGSEGWGQEVVVKQPVPADKVGLEFSQSMREWAKIGVEPKTVEKKRKKANRKASRQDVDASLIQPDGPDGPSFLVTNNFRILMKWNHSTYFATAVGMIADKL